MIRNVFKISALALAIAPAFSAFAMQTEKSTAIAKHPIHHPHKHYAPQSFNRIATFPVFKNTSIETESVAEIVAASKDGKTLIYTDSENEALGFVDIKNPRKPSALGLLALNGEPTSVATRGRYALAAVDTSTDFVNTSGELVIVDIETQTDVATIALDGQPDSIAVSPDGRYAAIAIENERDEDLGDGTPPQAPAGFLTIVDLVGAPQNWTTRKVDLTGVADLFGDDAEPEYVDINERNIAVVTLQENNHLVLVNLRNGKVINDFSAGSVDLKKIDTEEEDPALISLTSSLTDVPREPDGVTWLNNFFFATADEGDLNGGSRGFTIYNRRGKVLFTSGNQNDHLAVRLGHYPDARSGNKGNEPENVEFAQFGKDKYLFVGSERSSLVFVYKLTLRGPKYVQALPAGVGPEGLLAIPERDLFIAASEVDERGDKFRSVLNIYKMQNSEPKYPTIKSENRADGTPIPWSALSGLAMDRKSPRKAYTIHDSFYQQSRIFELDVSSRPAIISGEIVLKDSFGKLAEIQPDTVNSDGTVNLDQEGIATSKKGGFWIVSEGDDSPARFNLLVKVSANGDIKNVIKLPAETSANLVRFGFEGVAETQKGEVFVAFQREWANDPDNLVRIGRYSPKTNEWAFYYYPIEEPLSANGGWVGLSEIVSIGKDEFAVIERDNQGGEDAAIKAIYSFSVAGLEPLAEPTAGTSPSFPVVAKTLLRDLMEDLKRPNGAVPEKIEGLAFLRNGTALVVNDNDGVDDSNGETQLIKVRQLLQK